MVIRCNLCHIAIVPKNALAYQLMKQKPDSVQCSKCLEGKQRWSKSSYADYLKTEHWQEVRKKALERAGYHCQLCSSKDSLQAHHNSYERLGHELDSDLVVLCNSCHEKHHGVNSKE